MSTSKPLTGFAGLLLGSSLLAACGGGSAPASSAPASTPATTSPAASAAASKPAASASAEAKPAASASAAAKPAASGAAASGSAAAKPAASGSAAAKPAASGSAAAAAPPSVPASVTLAVGTSATLGKILTDDKNRTLYTFDRDTTPNESACTGGCLATWPPLYSNSAPTAPAGITGTMAVFTRADNSAKQVSLGGKPLYYYAADTNPGDTKGDGVGGNWHVIKGS